MDKFIRNCLCLLLIVFTLFSIIIQVKRFMNYSKHDDYLGAAVGTSNAKDFDMDVLLNRRELESARKCEATVLKPLPDVIRTFRTSLRSPIDIRTAHHTYMATGKRFLIEVGGQYGRMAKVFQKLYKPRHIILEPNKYTYKFLKKIFKTNKRVTVLNVGLSAQIGNDSVRYARKGPIPTEPKLVKKGWYNITLVDSQEFFKKLGVGPLGVDLLTFDCQGCEFEIIETMLLTNMTNLFKNIQMKWYNNKDYIKDPLHRYCRSIAMLSRTHRPTYMYPYVYENWRWKGLP